MNERRYKHYRQVSRVLSSDLFDAFEREVLLDAAEGLLLSRAPHSAEVHELQGSVDAALEGLLAAGRIHRSTAYELRLRITQCGPPGVDVVTAQAREHNLNHEQRSFDGRHSRGAEASH